MAALQFTRHAEEQLQHAFALSALPENQALYRRLVATLVHLENDAALFTLLEATPLPIAGESIYATRRDLSGKWTALTVAYEMSPATEDVTIVSMRWV